MRAIKEDGYIPGLVLWNKNKNNVIIGKVME